MQATKMNVLSNYRFLLAILIGISVGCVLGIYLKERAAALKPVGDLFLNLLFTVVTPLVFVSIASAVAGMASLRRLGRIFGAMLLVFVLTGAVAAVFMLAVTRAFPPASGVQIELKAPAEEIEKPSLGQQLVNTFTVSEFSGLLSRGNMLALIVFAMLFGLAVATSGDAGRSVAAGLQSLAHVIYKLVALIMFVAPVGLGAYFAYLVGVFGPELVGSYAWAMVVYYPAAIAYFFLAFTLYAALAGGRRGVRRFWRAIVAPAVTSAATGSSVATIPVNLEASREIGIPKDIREFVIPVGATIHMDGSALSAILKITFVAAIMGVPFQGYEAYVVAIFVALLSGTVMAGIPGGGFVGELLIATLYGFPPEALPVLAVLGTLVDPPATMVNATGDTVCGMLMARIIEGPDWIDKAGAAEPA